MQFIIISKFSYQARCKSGCREFWKDLENRELMVIIGLKLPHSRCCGPLHTNLTSTNISKKGMKQHAANIMKKFTPCSILCINKCLPMALSIQTKVNIFCIDYMLLKETEGFFISFNFLTDNIYPAPTVLQIKWRSIGKWKKHWHCHEKLRCLKKMCWFFKL